jgi:hypothetical protein
MILSKWLNSLKIYSLSVIGVHFVLFTFFFPNVVFYTIVLVMMFTVMYVWVDLIHTIEEAHRNDILNLIHTCESPETRNLLAYELYLHDENSLAGHRLFNSHGI